MNVAPIPVPVPDPLAIQTLVEPVPVSVGKDVQVLQVVDVGGLPEISRDATHALLAVVKTKDVPAPTLPKH